VGFDEPAPDGGPMGALKLAVVPASPVSDAELIERIAPTSSMTARRP
jgi:hypothetical protein